MSKTLMPCREVADRKSIKNYLGGDEFVVLQPNMPSMQAGADLAIRLTRALSQPFDIERHEVQISASIGIAVCPEDARDLDQLRKKADLALYRAKGEGKD